MSKVKKYFFTGETKEIWDGVYYRNVTLHRIQKVPNQTEKRFGIVMLGGWIEKEENLSHYGNCFVRQNACVYGDAVVCDEATVGEDARVFGNAKICGGASVEGDAQVYGNARLTDCVTVCEQARIYGNAILEDRAIVGGDAIVRDNAYLMHDAIVDENAEICGDALIAGHAIITGGTWKSLPLQFEGSFWHCGMSSTTTFHIGDVNAELSKWVENFESLLEKKPEHALDPEWKGCVPDDMLAAIRVEYRQYLRWACEKYAPELLEKFDS